MDHPENSAEYAGLQVNSGVEQPSIINPYLKRNRFRRRELSATEMVEGIIKGDITILSQAVTLVESVNPDHQAKAQEVINKCLPYSGNSIRIGISGVPGAGKSTSIDAFGIHVLKEHGGRLAVLAIDPSSERTKGSILGDKTRMEKLSVHPDSFIRPSPTAGSLGGVGRIRQDFRRDGGRGTVRDGLPLYGRLLPAAAGGWHRRRTAGHQAWHYGDI